MTAAMPAQPAPPADVVAAPAALLHFMLAGQAFAVALNVVREVIAWRRIDPMPMAPASVCGLVNLRGTVVPVVDLRRRFGWPHAAPDRRSCIVMLETPLRGALQCCGVLVDAVREVIAAEVVSPPELVLPLAGDVVVGIARHRDQVLVVLDAPRLLALGGGDAGRGADRASFNDSPVTE